MKLMLIDKKEISKHREVSRNVRDDKINPFIEDAELLDLKPLLGSAMYYDLVSNRDKVLYLDLLDGKEFEVDNVEYSFVGLKKVLSIFADARYKMMGSFTDSSFGFVEKQHQDSREVSQSSKKMYYTHNRQIAHQYFEGVKLFLDSNTSEYPLWKIGTKKNNTSFKISKIS